MTALERTLYDLSYELGSLNANGEYVLFGSTPLIMRGILDREPNDVDVFVSKRVWGALLARDETWSVVTPRAGDPPILAAQLSLETHLFYEWRDPWCEMDAKQLIQDAELVRFDGLVWSVVSIEEALRVKRDAYEKILIDPRVAKHGPDIDTIERYLQEST